MGKLLKIAALILAVVFAVQLSKKINSKELWAKSVLGQKAPELVVEKWVSHKPNVEGKILLIDFWATWCPPCRESVKELNKLQEKFAGKVVVIGISDEPEMEMRNFSEQNIRYASAVDTQARMKKALEVKGIPHVIVVDPAGIVRWEGFPMMAGHELTADVVSDIVNRYGNR